MRIIAYVLIFIPEENIQLLSDAPLFFSPLTFFTGSDQPEYELGVALSAIHSEEQFSCPEAM